MKHKIWAVIACCLAAVASASAQTPVIISAPASLLANSNSSALFSVTASNATQYQWQFNGITLTNATNSSLFYDNLTNTEVGSYTVVVTSAGGTSVTSAPPATLTLVPGTIATLTISNFEGGASSNIVVQLFDHDKPATVANFIHYITLGAYSNMFFDRCVPGFVLQGGTYDTIDQTNTAPGVGAFELYDVYQSGSGGVPLPDQVDSEFNNGVFIPNTFGTLAMALSGGNPNSATSAFFVNLADNSTNLDYQAGGFTVFGRVISGSNVLQFFNTLPNGSAGIVDYQDFVPEVAETNVPVNYKGTNEPSDANLFYCDFSLTNAPVYNTSNGPIVTVTSPVASALDTNDSVIIQGTAVTNQWTGIARVRCDIFPQSGIYQYQPFGTDAYGTTNWSLDFGGLPAGLYIVRAIAQDGYGVLGNAVEQYLTIWNYLTVTTSGQGLVSALPGIPLSSTSTYFTNSSSEVYSITAKPASGQVFAGWTDGLTTQLGATYKFMMLGNLTLIANFIPENMPKGITFTYPHPGESFTNGALTLEGRIPSSLTVTQLTCQLFVASNSVTTNVPVTRTATSWSLPVTNLAPGQYTAMLTAYDNKGRSRLIVENFNVMAQLTVVTGKGGSVFPKLNGKYLIPGKKYTITGTPQRGYIFGYWSAGVSNTLDATTTLEIESNTVLTATFVTNPYPAIAGTYRGIFLGGTNSSTTNSGSITLTTTATGVMSGTLAFPSIIYRLGGKFPYNGSLTFAVKLADGNVNYMFLNLDVKNGTDELTGGVEQYSGAGQILWTNTLIAYRAVDQLSGASNLPPGKYDLVFESATNDAIVDGYAALNVSAGGALAFSGALADNALISKSTSVSKGGVWPVYDVPASGKGAEMLIGWVTNTAAGCDGQLFWVKNGVCQVLNSSGEFYLPPVPGTQYQIAFSGGAFSGTNTLTVSAAGQFVAGSGSSDDLVISLSKSGVLTGKVSQLPLKGAFINPSQGGAGFVLGSGGATGSFQITAQP